MFTNPLALVHCTQLMNTPPYGNHLLGGSTGSCSRFSCASPGCAILKSLLCRFQTVLRRQRWAPWLSMVATTCCS